uniref:Uncharacterized protein n=1 Tax=viral metagenome TaxID=1070528 RepID=A0A6C0I600_9ZZZZ
MADNPCIMDPKCPPTLKEARELTKTCKQELADKCEETDRAGYCNYKKPSKYNGTRKTCKWLKRNPIIAVTTDITPEDIQIRQHELIRKDPQFVKKFIDANVCEHTPDTLDVRDALYFITKYKKDKDHVIYMPECNESKTYVEEDFIIDWNGKDENYKGSLKFPRGFRKRLQDYKSKLGGKTPWVAILLVLHSDAISDYHSNVLFYYPKTETVERIEAAGYRFPYFDQEELDNRLYRAFKRWGIKFMPTIDVLPRMGPAKIAVLEEENIEGEDISGDPGGFCQTWSYFILDQRFRHPNESAMGLFERVIDKVINSNHTFLEIVRSFHGVIQKAVPKLLKKIGFTGKSSDLDDYFYENYAYIAQTFDLC